MALPTKVTLDLDALTDAQLVAVYRTIDESGLHSVKGITFTDVQTLVHNRAAKPGFAVDVKDLEAAYVEASDFLFPAKSSLDARTRSAAPLPTL